MCEEKQNLQKPTLFDRIKVEAKKFAATEAVQLYAKEAGYAEIIISIKCHQNKPTDVNIIRDRIPVRLI